MQLGRKKEHLAVSRRGCSAASNLTQTTCALKKGSQDPFHKGCPPSTFPLQWGRGHPFHVPDGETEAQRGEVISLSSHSISVGELGPESESRVRVGLSVFLISNPSSLTPHSLLSRPRMEVRHGYTCRN